MDKDLCPICRLPRRTERHLAGCPHAGDDQPAITGPHLCRARDDAGLPCILRAGHDPKQHVHPISDGELKVWTD